MKRYKLLISYDGTPYVGWQAQRSASAIQPLIQKALVTVLRHPTALTGAGRTDAGVHALGQTAHFESDIPFTSNRLLLSLNALLPPEIRILSVESVPPTFHARYSAVAKVYHYHLFLGPVMDPFLRRYRHWVRGPCDLSLLEQALAYFRGCRDFTSFANLRDSAREEGVACKRGNSRTIFRLEMVPEPGGVRLEMEGDGFLYKMVRNIVGALLDVAAGRLELEVIPAIFRAKDRKVASAAAPAQGLFLVSVKY